MLGTPIWQDMRVQGPRMKNPSAIPDLQYMFPPQMNRMNGNIKKNMFYSFASGNLPWLPIMPIRAWKVMLWLAFLRDHVMYSPLLYIKYPIVHIVLVPRVHCCNKVVLKRLRCVCGCLVVILNQVKLQNITALYWILVITFGDKIFHSILILGGKSVLERKRQHF